jgi:FkbM family methyltransferase
VEELRIRPAGVLHVGAHTGEEVPRYLEAGFTKITLVEPDPESCAIIAARPWIDEPGIGIVNRACGLAGTAVFHRAEATEFSSLLTTGKAGASFPVTVVPISDIQAEHGGNVLVVDTQGTELEALRTADLAPLDLVVIETQTEQRGAPGAFLPDVLTWCRESGWAPRIQWKRDDRWSDLLLTPRRASEPMP